MTDKPKQEESPLQLELQAIKAQLNELSKEQLIDELAMYKFIIPKLGPWVEWAVQNMYKPFGARWRMGRESVGLLIGVLLVPEAFVILSQEEIRKYEQKKIIYEQHIVYAPLKELAWYDVILGKIGEEKMKI